MNVEGCFADAGQHNLITENERAQPTRILVVDDDAAIRHMLTNYLEL